MKHRAGPSGSDHRGSQSVTVKDETEHAPATRTIARAIQILHAFDETRPELGVTELSQLTRLDKSTVYRLLSALQQGGLIEQDAATAKYRPGFGLVRLAGLVMQHQDLPQVAHPQLQELAHRFQETVHLSTMTEDCKLVYIDSVTSTHRVRTTSRIGQEAALHAVSGGKVLMAYMPAEELDDLLHRPLERFTDKTTVEADRLRKELDEIGRQGYAIASDELEDGLSDVASPIHNQQGQVIAALSISGPTFRLTPARLVELGSATLEAANSISRKLGYRW
jgi:DNA-binding IclR family transcriptional regulator